MVLRALFLCILGAAGSPAASGQIMVRGDWVALSDVAPVEGQAGRTLLGPAPPPGETLALDPVFVAAVAKRAGVVLALPAGSPILVTRAAAPEAGSPTAPATAPEAPRAPVAEAPKAVLVAALARDLPRGAIVRREDITLVPSPARYIGQGEGRPEDFVGLETRRALKAFSPIRSSDFRTPPVIRKGERVKLVYSSSGLRLTVDGLAQSDAARGEAVRVLNTHSRRTIDAVAESAGEARILPLR